MYMNTYRIHYSTTYRHDNYATACRVGCSAHTDYNTHTHIHTYTHTHIHAHTHICVCAVTVILRSTIVTISITPNACR